MIALGTVRLASFASSDSVETASNPRKDRHSSAAPVKTEPNPSTVPSPASGAIRFTLPDPDIEAIDITTNTAMNRNCNPMMTTLAHDTETMPTMLSIVTAAIATRIHTHVGTAGSAAPI